VAVKNYVLVPIFIVSMIASWFIWDHSPDYIRQGGPLLVVGLTCLFLVFTFGIERFLVLWRAGGKGSVVKFTRALKGTLGKGDVGGAIQSAKQQGGSLANVIGAGLERFQSLRGSSADRKEVMEGTRRALEEAGSLETPYLERNLSALATLASIATMVGLLGTTIGMIRAFRAMSRAGAPDATQLALGISEALVNTALGLTTAIIGIVLYNYFTTRVDNFNSTMEETSYEVLQTLQDQENP
jgi:biopolymer transport protein ExbB